MKVAILHYWFLLRGGGDRVITSLLSIYPDADVFCLFADRRFLPAGLSPSRLHCSFLDRVPLARRMNRALFSFYPAAVGSFDFSGYDLVISSDSPPTKAIVPPVGTVHISYCHTPGRFIWDLAPSFQSTLPRIARPVFATLAAQARTSDFVAAQRVDHFIANSWYIAQRIHKYYRRNSTVIYPPVDVKGGWIAERNGDYYLSVGRLVGTKRLDIVIEACNRLHRRLVIAGTGREEKNLKSLAGPTIEFLGRVPDEDLPALYASCRAFLFAADEDFGIAPVEAQAFGRPVIAYGHGGSLETVRVNDLQGQSDTGVFFQEQTVESLMEGIFCFEAREDKFIPAEIQQHTWQFDTSIFVEKMRLFIDATLKKE